MELLLDELNFDAKDYDFDDGGVLRIRPFPQSMDVQEIIPGGGIVMDGGQALKKFMYCLVGWSGVLDRNGNPVPCTEEAKKMVFDANMKGIPRFVRLKSEQFFQDKAVAEKNS